MSATDPIQSDISIHVGRLTFDDTTLFDGLNLALPAGKWTCLMGVSGVGKSTLLRLVAGLMPEETAMTIKASESGLEGQIAYMAQDDLLLPWLTVFENVVLGARLRGDEFSTGRALHLLEQLDLLGSAYDLPATLSGGMRQRAALARTLMEDRPVVLMDEPFSALDAITRVRLQDFAAEMLQDRTVLLVTHDPLEAFRLADRIHVMSGRPAVLFDPIEPEGKSPRDMRDPDLLAGQAELLERLTRSKMVA
jgi:putative hydroxymethylpyrimidine transport system ATP-binding protein